MFPRQVPAQPDSVLASRRRRLPAWRLPARDQALPWVLGWIRRVNPIVAFRAIALFLALIIVASDLHMDSNLRDDGWLLLVAAVQLGLTTLAAPRLAGLSDRVNVVVIAADIATCVALVAWGDGWSGPFWLYGVSGVFWPAYRFGVRGALASVAVFDAGVLLTGTDKIHETLDEGFGGDLLARLTMVLIVAGAVALTARALAQVKRLAAEAERNRIARDLHDGVGKTLGGISLEASSLAYWIERDPAEARRRVRYVTRVSERAANDVRDVIRSLRQQQATAPLLADVRATVDEWSRARREVAHVQLNGHDLATPVLIRAEVLRMLNELLENVQRHADAREVWVRVTLSKLGVTLAVRDDGVGFDTARFDPWADDGHFGLLGARERTQMLGGRFNLQSSPGEGVEVTIDLPLVPRDERPIGLR